MNNFEWLLVIAGGFILALLLSSYLGKMNIPVSWVLYVIIIVSLMSTETVNLLLKLNTPKLVATNFDSTTDGAFIPCGNYAIFTLGDIDYVFKIKGTQGAVIAPRDAVNKLGKNVVLTINPKMAIPNELPFDVLDAIKQYNIEPPYFMGFISERQELVEPSSARMETEIKEQNSLLNVLRDISKGKFGTVEDIVEFVKRVKEETKGRSWLQKLLVGKEEKEKSGEE